jgi:hypothetical protein
MRFLRTLGKRVVTNTLSTVFGSSSREFVENLGDFGAERGGVGGVVLVGKKVRN